MPENKSIAKSTYKKIISFLRTKWGIALIVCVVIVAGFFLLRKKTSPYTFVPVTKGSITEAVSVTGNTSPVQSVTLGFENSGTVAGVYSAVGQSVYIGQLLAQLNASDLSAQLRQAQANVDAQQAKLDSLKVGSRPEDVASSEASLGKATQDLANMYASIADTSNDSYAKANDAVRTQLDNLFSNPENSSVQLTYTTTNTQAATDAKTERIAAGTVLTDWQKEISNANSLSHDPMSSVPTLDKLLSDGVANLSKIRQLLVHVSATLDGSVSLNATTLAAYKASVAAAMTEVNTASKNLNSAAQSIASQKQTVAGAQAQLNLKKAGSSAQDIAAGQAQVEQAQASLASIQAKLSNSRIVSPINGIVTQFDAKVGQGASLGAPLVSVISNSQFEIQAQIPETDIGKVAVGNPADLTFDAFPGQTFAGKVFYIDPAQTINQGVVDYKIKVSFDTPDPKMKSGLTANLTIKTKTNDNTLILPQYAVLQNDSGTFVKKLVAGVATTTSVKLGIQGQNGSVEILSGVSEGEKVINIGLK